jgi:hypothetical protein
MTRTIRILRPIGIVALTAFAILRLVASDWDAALVSLAAAALLAMS